MEQINVRNLALDVVLAVTRDGEFSHVALGNMLEKYSYLDKSQRAFLTRLSQGTLERMIELDYIINRFSKTKINKMKPVIRAILRTGVYQLKYMDSVPVSAACNEAVKLAVKRGFSGLKGFVNGVMRSVARGLDAVVYPDPETDPVAAVSVRCSLPEWLAARWIRIYGTERVLAFGKAFFEKQNTMVRVDETQISVTELTEALRNRGIRVQPGRWLSYALELSGYDMPEAIPEFRQGYFYIQDIASMMVAETIAPAEGSRILDVCAAPGGKSIHLAQMMKGTGMVTARDLTELKAERIRENRERCRVANLEVQVQDAREYREEDAAAYDVVVADLPCSGLGVLGSKPDIRYNASEEKIRELAALQYEILSVVHRYVKPGGVLLYSTCTVTQEENQDNLARFLKEHPNFSGVSERQYLPDEGCDGFYIAKMVRNS